MEIDNTFSDTHQKNKEGQAIKSLFILYSNHHLSLRLGNKSLQYLSIKKAMDKTSIIIYGF